MLISGLFQSMDLNKPPLWIWAMKFLFAFLKYKKMCILDTAFLVVGSPTNHHLM